MIEAFATTAHYARHLEPVVQELSRRGHQVERRQRGTGEEPALRLVASWVDARRDRTVRTVYVEHGAGQTYVESYLLRGYAGADGLEHVVLFLTPSDRISDRWREAYPRAIARAVGCPALDRHALANVGQRRGVAITMHWRCSVLPETRPALPWYEAHGALTSVVQASQAAAGFTLVGHGHPRAEGYAQHLWRSHGVRYEPDPDRVLASAAVLVADNTSLMYEAAALGIPVVALNAPWYRREVEHGLRFWSHVPGIQVDRPDDLLGSIYMAMIDSHHARAAREEAAAHAYAYPPGGAAARAADAIEELL